LKKRNFIAAGAIVALVASGGLFGATAANAASEPSKNGGAISCGTQYASIQAELKVLPGDAGYETVTYSGGSQFKGFTNSAYEIDDFVSAHHSATQTNAQADYVVSMTAYCG
jgi:hypothetical protein